MCEENEAVKSCCASCGITEVDDIKFKIAISFDVAATYVR